MRGGRELAQALLQGPGRFVASGPHLGGSSCGDLYALAKASKRMHAKHQLQERRLCLAAAHPEPHRAGYCSPTQEADTVLET